MQSYHSRLLCCALLLLPWLGVGHAMPARNAPQTHLHTTSRSATWTDVRSEFRLVYNATQTAKCPEVVGMGLPTVDNRQIGELPVSLISEDEFNCSGATSMSIVTESTVRRQGLLTDIGLPQFRQALQENPIATGLMSALRESGALVGWHSSIRACRDLIYDNRTIYFFFKSDDSFSFRLQTREKVEEITFPPLQTTLFVVRASPDICLYTDKSSNPDADVVLESDGNKVVLTPAGYSSPPGAAPTLSVDAVSPAPTPSVGAVVSVAPSGAPQTAVPNGAPQTAVPSGAPQTAVPSGAPQTAVPSGAVPLPSGIISAVPSGAIPVQSLTPTAAATGLAVATPSALPVVVAGEPPLGAGGLESEPPTQSSEMSGEGACFPRSATVVQANGVETPMHALHVGDRVHTGGGQFSPVILFTHRASMGFFSFVRVVTASGHTLVVSPGHYVRVGRQLRAAAAVRIGDALVHGRSGAPLRVIAVHPVCARGLFNPQTSDGSIVVGGVVASTYTTTVDAALAHRVLMGPMRLVFAVSERAAEWVSQLFDHGAPRLASLLPSGASSILS